MSENLSKPGLRVPVGFELAGFISGDCRGTQNAGTAQTGQMDLVRAGRRLRAFGGGGIPGLARSIVLATLLALTTAATVHAVPFTNITVGDRDSFGFSSLAGLVSATGAPVDTNGNGVLDAGEFLPDINRNGAVAVRQGDNYDNRSAAEKADTLLTGAGFTNVRSRGSEWTDLTLSSTFLPAADFPDGDPTRPNEPLFIFNFNVASADIVPGTPLVLTMLFGDIDVGRAFVIVGIDGSRTRIALTHQPDAADGLIQSLVVPLSFAQVFEPIPGGFHARVAVDTKLRIEPYTVWDFVQLAAAQTPPPAVAEPSTILLLGSGLVLLAILLGRRKVQAGRMTKQQPPRSSPQA